MLFKKKEKNIEQNKEVKTSNLPYEKEFETKKLKVFVVIVNRNQGDFFVKKFEEIGVSASFLVYGVGTATREIYDILGVGDIKKDIVLSLIKQSDIEKIKEIVSERFSISKNAKGIAFSLGIDSVAGILIYKYLSNTRENKRRVNNGTKSL